MCLCHVSPFPANWWQVGNMWSFGKLYVWRAARAIIIGWLVAHQVYCALTKGEIPMGPFTTKIIDRLQPTKLGSQPQTGIHIWVKQLTLPRPSLYWSEIVGTRRVIFCMNGPIASPTIVRIDKMIWPWRVSLKYWLMGWVCMWYEQKIPTLDRLFVRLEIYLCYTIC
jgi:hypothetical protein